MAMKELDKIYRKVIAGLHASIKGEVTAVKEGNFGADVTEQFGTKALTHTEIRAAFSRQELEAEYQKSLDTQKLKDSDISRLVLQNDVIASIEKAFRMRGRSRMQLLVSGVSRAAGTSSDNGFTKYALENLPVLSGAADA